MKYFLLFIFICFIYLNIYSDDKFLDKIQKDSFNYFLYLYDETLGLIPDSSREGSPCSIAACGFGIVSFCIAAERNWISKEEAYRRIYKTLKSFLNKVGNKNGFFYHFVGMKTGERVWLSEVSSIDTALFLAGAIVAAEYFKGTEVEILVNKIYDRVNWKWMLDEDKGLMYMGWKPEQGFLPYYWQDYSELIVLLALAIGAKENSIPEECWYKWEREKVKIYNYEYIASETGSLFTYQYPHIFIDFRKLLDKFGNINYFENSKIATLVDIEFCKRLKYKYKTHTLGFWGLSACLGPQGYRGYGAGPKKALYDGTVAPSAVAGCIIFLPEVCISSLKIIYDTLKDKVYCEYGFVNGFNLEYNWFSRECLGIDTGVILLSIENYRSGFVWKHFMKNE
ncbi:MAG: glucoamylase family protein, partial [Candidatus Aenigmatarchaeota archaeon]